MTWESVRLFAEAAISIFAIVNPVGNLPVFAGLTEDIPVQDRRRVLRLAGVVALCILVAMAVAGSVLLDKVFHIRIQDFMFAGGALLLVVGIRNVLGEVGRRKNKTDAAPVDRAAEINLAVSPLATPLLVGPGSIVTIMLIVKDNSTPPLGWLHGTLFGVGAALVAFVFVIAVLNWAHKLLRLIGPIGTAAVGRIMQIFIVAIGVRFIFRALGEMFPQLAR